MFRTVPNFKLTSLFGVGLWGDGDLGVRMLCALLIDLLFGFTANLVGGVSFPFKTGGFGAKFGLPWLITGLFGCKPPLFTLSVQSKELRFALLFDLRLCNALLWCKLEILPWIEVWLRWTPFELLVWKLAGFAGLRSSTDMCLVGAGGGGPLALVSLGLCNCFFNWSWMLSKCFEGVNLGLGLLSLSLLFRLGVDELIVPSRPVTLSLGIPPANKPPSAIPFGFDWMELFDGVIPPLEPVEAPLLLLTALFFPWINGALLSTVTVFFSLVPCLIELNRAPLLSDPPPPPPNLGSDIKGGGGGPGGGGGGGPGILFNTDTRRCCTGRSQR